jgi:hypothetical protein
MAKCSADFVRFIMQIRSTIVRVAGIPLGILAAPAPNVRIVKRQYLWPMLQVSQSALYFM